MAEGDRPKTRLKMIPVAQIRESSVALRKVDKKTPEYAEMLDSVKKHGIYNPIVVRELKDDDGKVFYGVVEGLHRWNLAMDAGMEEIPAHVYNMQDAEVLEAQVIGNAQRIETKPVEYTNQLRKIFGQNPTMTLMDMANKLSKSVAWVSQRLKLADLPKHVGQLVDDGKITLSNAYALVDIARLAPEEVDNFLDRAQTLAPTEFAPVVQQRVKALRDARREGKKAGENNEFVPVPHVRKPASIKGEFNSPTIRDQVLNRLNAKSVQDGWQAALAWVVHMDPISIEEGKKEFEAEKAAQEEARRIRNEEKERKRKEEASKATQEAINA
jgi:ParB/RepB/Spo0J family partition protein